MENQDVVDTSAAQALDSLAHRMSNPKLMALRCQNPFIDIMPFPNKVVSVLLAAGVPQDITIPSQAKLVRFSGNGEYYVSRNGNAQIPDGTPNTSDSGSIMNPENNYWYVEEIQSLSVVSAIASVRLTVEFFSQM